MFFDLGFKTDNKKKNKLPSSSATKGEKSGISFEISANLVIYNPSVGEPKLCDELNVPIADADKTKIKILILIENPRIKIKGLIKILKASIEGSFYLRIKI
jgi:hypothetical protein